MNTAISDAAPLLLVILVKATILLAIRGRFHPVQGQPKDGLDTADSE